MPGRLDPLFSSKKMDWETPQDFFDALDRRYRFTLDAASSDENAKCEKHYTAENSGLDKSWRGERVWCNPPYGRDIPVWVEKCCRESEHAFVALLIPARTDTRYFQDMIYGNPRCRVVFLKGRLRFEQDGTPLDAAPFPSMLVLFNERFGLRSAWRKEMLKAANLHMVALLASGRMLQMIDRNFMMGLGSGLAVGMCLGIAAELAYEKWQDRKAYDEAMGFQKEMSERYGYSEGVDVDGDSAYFPLDGSENLMTESFKINPMEGESKPVTAYSKMYASTEDKGKAFLEGMEAGIADAQIDISDENVVEIREALGENVISDISIITDEDFNTVPEFEKVYCTYTQDDDGRFMLTNDYGNDEMVVESTIGQEAIDRLDEMIREANVDPDGEIDPTMTIYVRNRRLLADYMVTAFPYVE